MVMVIDNSNLKLRENRALDYFEVFRKVVVASSGASVSYEE